MRKSTLFMAIPFLLASCSTQQKDVLTQVNEQYSLMLQDAEAANKNPRTFISFYTDSDGKVSEKKNELKDVVNFENYMLSADGDTIRKTHWINSNAFDWTQGFFPGSCWYMYELTGEAKWKEAAEKFQGLIRKHTSYSNHDLGFSFNCSFGNGLRLTGEESYGDVMVEAANTLAARYNDTTKVILSWNVDRGWQAERGWKFPVIIDNMMNLELLFEATKLTGDQRYREIAITHANTTMKNHFRPDASCVHVVDYDPATGAVRMKQTAQGYADSSSWSRGQGWAIYGYTMCYRYTQDPAYLAHAEKIAAFIMNHPNTPTDKVPLWDYDVPASSKYAMYRDASAASIIASAMYELCGYAKEGDKYKAYADELMTSLCSPSYLAEVGENNHFLLKHSVGSIPHMNEKDVPLNYADYYFLEALIRQGNLKK